jgi:hypothetical protein
MAGDCYNIYVIYDEINVNKKRKIMTKDTIIKMLMIKILES